MQVRFVGFYFSTTNENLSLSDYINSMIKANGAEYKFGGYNRMIFFNSSFSEDYYVGLFVTIKDQKTYCELMKNEGKSIIRINEAKNGTNLMDFNFFVINKKTGAGIYQYYHHSCSLGSFAHFNSNCFFNFRKSKIEMGVASCKNNKEKKEIKSKFSGKFKWEIIVTKENLHKVLAELKEIKAFDCCLATPVVSEPEFKPLGNYVKKERKRLTFFSTSPVKKLADIISNIVDKGTVESGRVIGSDLDGVQKILKIINCPDSFGEYHYDDVAAKINSLDMDQFENSWVIQELLDKCEEYKYIFKVEAK